MIANIIGPDLIVVIAVVALLFGGSQLPKLARSLGSAKSEFQKGLDTGAQGDNPAGPAATTTPTTTPTETTK
ncbi:MAG: twin-arginine translocase TatA/TatE family subunit [Acidimicrobiales bacterium]